MNQPAASVAAEVRSMPCRQYMSPVNDALENPAEFARFEELLTEHRERIFRYIYSLVPRQNDAEDLFQAASVVMWNKFAEYDRQRSFAAWACGIAYFEVQNFRRRVSKDMLMFSSDVLQALSARFEAADQFEAAVRLEALRECLGGLPDRDRTLVHRIYWDGVPYERAAEACSLAVQTVYNRMNLIRRRLAHCVGRRLKTHFNK